MGGARYGEAEPRLTSDGKAEFDVARLIAAQLRYAICG